MRRRNRRERVALPWEGRRAPWLRVFTNTRWHTVGALLAAGLLLVGFYRYAKQRVVVHKTQVAIAQVKEAIDRFRTDLGRCPNSWAELLHPPIPQKRYLQHMPKDGWNRELSIQCPGYFGDDADVISAGPSGSLLTDDNIQ